MASLKDFVPFYSKLNKAYGDVKNLIGSEADPYSFYMDHGVHQTCWYDIKIDVPQKVQQLHQMYTGQSLSATKLTERLNMLCVDVQTPQLSISSDALRVGGEKIEVPYDITYEELTTSFYVDGGYADDGGVSLKLFQSWLATIYPPALHAFAYMSDYTTTITITMYSTPDSNPSFKKEKLVEFTIKDA